MSRHLIHIGFPKAGSTSIGEWFAAHPRLAYVPHGIGGYRGPFDIASYAADPGRSQPEWHVTSSESLSMPRITDRPSLQDRADSSEAALEESRERVCSTLHDLFPGATILIVTRGFRGALVSNYSQYVRAGGRVGLRELYAPHAESLAGYLDFDGVASLYSEVFGAERVIVLPYELMRDDPAKFVRILEERLEIERSGVMMPTRNRAPSAAAIARYRAVSAVLAGALRPLGGRLSARIWERYVGWLCSDRSGVFADWAAGVIPHRAGAAAEVPDEVLERCRGHAAALGRSPLYLAYADEYLNPPAREPVAAAGGET
jgi:hypothetical protein